MTGPIANKIGVVNQGTVYNQTNHITIHEGQQVALIYSDPVPDLRFFQGRETELSHLNSWLADQAVRIIGVRGEGGIGKSTLVAKAFAESLGFAGKFWADVRTGTSITALAARALQELGVLPDQVRDIEEKDLIPRLLCQLQRGRYLLAIDNLESVLIATGEWQSGYEEFLNGFENLGSESVLLLASREYSPKYLGWLKSEWLTVEQGLKPAEGAALLAALEVEDTVANRAAVSMQVQGNPLALSLVAGWLREEYRPGERLVAPLRQQTDLLQLEGKHRGEAQISVERVLQWSIDRLTPENQHLLTQVSVFRGAFNAEAAAALMLEQPVSDADLDDLERRSLLQALLERNKARLKLYRLQPRIRDFVQKRTADLPPAHERAIDYFWSHRQTEFGREDTQDAVSDYEETFYHQCQLRRYQQALEAILACDEFLRRRGHYQFLVNLYSQLHRECQLTLEKQQDHTAVYGNLKAVYYVVCSNLGAAYQFLGQHQRAIDFHQQFLAIARKIGARNSEANSLNNLGAAYSALGQYQQAIDFHQQSLAIAGEIGDRSVKANSLGSLGVAYQLLGQYQQAIDFHQQHYEIAREVGDRRGEAISLDNLGLAYRVLGQYQRAIDFHQQSLAINREIGERGGEAAALNHLGNAYFTLGQYQQAIKFQQQHYEIVQQIGDRRGEAAALGNLGAAYSELGQHQRAIDFHQKHYEIAREIGDRCGEAISLNNLGAAYSGLGQYQQAIDFHQKSLTIKREIGDRGGEANSLDALGSEYKSLGQYQQAINFHQQSLIIQREISNRRGEGRSLFNMGYALAKLDRHYEALQSYQQALAVYEALKLDHMVEKCKTAIAERNRIIAAERRVVPTIGEPRRESDWWERSLPSSARSAPRSARRVWWQQWWLWFVVGLAILLIVWWLR